MSAFKAVPIHTAFKKGMKVEVVDRRNPILVRVATIADVLLRQIKVRGSTAILGYTGGFGTSSLHYNVRFLPAGAGL